MLLACLPFGPCVTSKETFWPSFSVLNPGILIAEKCAKRSSPPPSGVMKPKPFASLNHFTVPVAISEFPQDINYRRAGARPMFHSQGQKSTGPQSRRVTGLGRALVLETKHLWDVTRTPGLWEYPDGR